MVRVVASRVRPRGRRRARCERDGAVVALRGSIALKGADGGRFVRGAQLRARGANFLGAGPHGEPRQTVALLADGRIDSDEDRIGGVR